ncbi:phosphatidate cytidylyltransferase [Candidatus Saccharibacteria bacterium]|nr:phosphatidate cytidylyltransferase [Candidatus Saccharibacteria bacterium]
MDRNFKIRLVVGVAMFIVAVFALYYHDGILFKFLYALFATVAMVELFSFFKKKTNGLASFLAILEIVFLIWSAIFVVNINLQQAWYIILGVPGYDVFAYLFGKKFGGKIFKQSRPFPHISKNKTWEGTISGLVIAILLVTIKMCIDGDFATDWMFLLCGPLALLGDLFESYLKRRFNIKDSNEIIIKNKFFSKLEILVGGSDGHGGFLDRIDSTAFTCAIFLVITSLI